MNQQEIIQKLSILEQKINQFQEQIQAIEQGIVELSSLSFGLEELNSSEGKEIYAELGRGIFIPAKISSENIIVDVGNKNFVQKTIPETKSLIEKQIKNLEKVKESLKEEFISSQSEISELIEAAQSIGTEKKK